MAEEFQVMPVPGQRVTKTYTDPELMYSMKGYTQKGCTLAGGQGILRLGTILAQHPTTLRYYAYGSVMGGSHAVGFLRRSADTNANDNADQQVNIVIAGLVKQEYVSGVGVNPLDCSQDWATDLNARCVPELGEHGVVHF